MEYSAILNQSGTNDPVATVLKNDFSQTLTWSRDSQGIYALTSSAAAFDSNKTISLIGTTGEGEDMAIHFFGSEWQSTTVIWVYAFENESLSDSLDDVNFTLRVYQ